MVKGWWDLRNERQRTRSGTRETNPDTRMFEMHGEPTREVWRVQLILRGTPLAADVDFRHGPPHEVSGPRRIRRGVKAALGLRLKPASRRHGLQRHSRQLEEVMPERG